ncbi:MAG: hypothetical protein GF411_16725 [Candidatus Lokiarchaeota archaeon]|nr:hypothetical protein [Candidatus Lokiarchaeota archaeon]
MTEEKQETKTSAAKATKPTSKEEWVQFLVDKRTIRFVPNPDIALAVSMHNDNGVMVVRLIATGKRDVISLWERRKPWDRVTDTDIKKMATQAYQKYTKVAAIIRQ